MNTTVISMDDLFKVDKSVTEYIDFQSICEDYHLEHGDISPEQVEKLRIILAEFIKQNWK